MHRLAKRVVLAMLWLPLSACYESPSVTLHAPGEYKGRPDPLLAVECPCERQEALRRRLAEGQRDR